MLMKCFEIVGCLNITAHQKEQFPKLTIYHSLGENTTVPLEIQVDDEASK